jgi:CRISPR-associated protein Cas1
MRRIDLIVEEYGLKLGRTGGRLTVRRGGEVVQELPLQLVRSIRVTCGGVSLSSDIILACAAHQIPLHITDYSQQGIARLSSPLHDGDTHTRREQLLAMNDARGVEIMRTCVSEKIRAQGRWLRYVERRARDAEQFAGHLDRLRERYQQIHALHADCVRDIHPQLLGHEGFAARSYWQAFGLTLPPGLFPGRKGRGARDVINVMLNYGYAVLRGRVWGMIDRAGLDPYAGFLHLDRVGRAGLVFDLMEPYRVIVDDAVSSIARRARSPLPSEADRRLLQAVARDVTARLDAPADFGPRRARVGACMQQGVRTVGAFLRGDGELRLFRWDVRGPKEPSAVRDPLERFFKRIDDREA